ncbi:nitronate monooxygenase family protein [Mycolicibacterium austroafricanum]|jgi:NAD(P)H-dependent flavin oxidoreductase YrpB (nitropropane dioxygenase family)|uniref:Nitronate monooxygenase family protein n=1 Tax=Mycolicibacterium austroafricanum TaxID=39687 RepID=A0ABT8HB08_MYCAO|nr:MULTISPECIES: nitronate monooxygenase family protein [Mycolicibacterium]MDN4517944.1 nitronate monooxygenase family protein [Mycolicibacterium austroafricanum]PQP40929.1 monooxygenase [Mycolicibacterium austroafricanum]QRZ06289.1 nitronate monooxygenase [Mycolicibacterium austroafricanum]QZT56386.1 nitronate monooxygenase family protein [Mycolicibacterium austroafricanum]QZT67764.1 nitronate monooxygenase family protein [Mycolicibacterium austroafricanum]
MKTELCDRFGIEYPLFVFTPSEKVAAAVSKAGGLGVLGCVRFNDADDLENVLQWMDANTDGKPYGVDIVMPAKVPTEGTSVDINKLIPTEHREFVDKTLADLGVPPLPADEERSEGVLGWLHSVARSHVEVALKHPIKLIANALGSPPKDVIDQAHQAGVPVAALAGSAKHALRHVDNGVDIVVAQGHEAGGHTGEIGSMVLWPEIVDAIEGRAPVLAAGGIGTGRQVAAALALGAQGVWMGSAFLTSAEYDLGVRLPSGRSVVQEAMLNATSADTVRRRIYTGKPARLLKSRWTDAWDADGAPEPLPMPLQNILVSEAHQRMSENSDPTAVAMPVGQIVGRMNEIRPVADIIAELVSGFEEATRRLDAIRDN